jgi:hypothetical protein
MGTTCQESGWCCWPICTASRESKGCRASCVCSSDSSQGLSGPCSTYGSATGRIGYLGAAHALWWQDITWENLSMAFKGGIKPLSWLWVSPYIHPKAVADRTITRIPPPKVQTIQSVDEFIAAYGTQACASESTAEKGPGKWTASEISYIICFMQRVV